MHPTSRVSKGEAVAFGDAVEDNPFTIEKIEKLAGYDSYYKAWFGAYQVDLRLDAENQVIEFMRVHHRRDIYQRFP